MHSAIASSSTPFAAPMARMAPSPAHKPAGPLLGVTRSYGKDDEIFADGDRAAYFYMVKSGVVRTCKLLEDGRRHIDAFHLPGDFFGIESGKEHRFGAEAVMSATVIAYPRASLTVLAASGSELGRQVVAALMSSLERAHAQMLLLGRKSAMERIATFLLDLSARLPVGGQLDLPMSRADIADHLGLTIETVSRSLTQLERQGVIALPSHRRSILLRDKAALRRLDA